MNNTQNYWW